MTKSFPWLQNILVCGFTILASTPAVAQIAPDNTLGAESSRLTPNVLINGAASDRIDGGAARGSNLFHSFSDFNIDDGQRVYFSNPSGIQNILTRVTGGNASSILGTLGVDGGANLFLLNPNGIIFGQNASLDLRSSFVGTTANAIGFGEQGFFSATNPQAPPLLSVNPSALLFTQLQAPAGITNQSIAPAGLNPDGNSTTGLRVPDGKSLLLVGSNVSSDGGRLRAYGGRIELTGLSAPGSVGLNVTGNTLSLNVPNDVPRADVSLNNDAAISVFGAGGGDIVINARNLKISSSALFAGIGENLGNAATQAGDITLNATGAITIAQTSSVENSVYANAKGNGGNIFIQAQDSVSLASGNIFTNVEAGGVGKGGNININALSLSVAEGSQIQTLLRGVDPDNNLVAARGDAGNVNVDVSGAVSIAGVKDRFPSAILSKVETGAEGNGGNINIKSATFSLTDGARLNVSTSGKGNAGSIFIQAADSVSLVNGGSIYSSIFQGGEGNGGSININTGSLTVNKGGELNASVEGSGNGGNININARDAVNFDGKGEEIFSRTIAGIQPGATGKAGDIQITTGGLWLTNGAFLSNSTLGKGDAGNITIDASDAVTFDSVSYAQSNVFEDGVGKGGNIEVTTGTLQLTNGSQLSTNVAGQGEAGNITVNARDAVNFDGKVGDAISGIQSSLLTGAVGKAGDIQIATGSLSLTNGALLSSNSNGQGNAGNVTVNARDTITFEGESKEKFINPDGTEGSLVSSASSTLGSNGIGNGGNIRVNGRALFLKNGGQINASSFGQGNAGSINIDTSDTVSFDGVSSNGLESGAFTLGSKGNGGDILVTTENLSLTNGSKLSTFARGNAGNITINASDITFDGVSSNGDYSGANSLLLPGGTTGKGGDIQIATNSLSVTNGAQLVANTAGQGNGGNITIDARDTVKFDGVGNNGISSGAYSQVSPTAVGKAGNIKLTTGSLSLTNGGLVSANTFGQGNAGDITIDARDTVNLDGTGNNGISSGVFGAVGNGGVGKGGNIRLTSNLLSLNNNTYLSAVTAGNGDAGNIFVQAADFISLSNSGYILSNIASGGVGNSGSIDIDTRNLTLTDGSQIGAAVVREFGGVLGGKGRGGEIRIKAIESVTLSGISPTGFSSGITALTERGASGDAGNITVDTGNFRVADGAVVTAATFNDGNAGNVTINANNLEAVNGGQVANITSSSGNAGAIRLNVRDGVTLAGSDPNYNNRLALVEQQTQSSGSTDRVSDIVPFDSGSGIFANTSFGSTGDGGSIFIDPRQVTIRDGAKVSVNSEGAGNAGNITLQAGTLNLDNGTISAQTASSTGGNIDLQLRDVLLLRRGSQISTTAGTASAGGDGGNITINTPFIVALPNENSDISANAFTGRGGNISISTESIFGIQARSQLTPQSDITASSESGVQGQISITEPNVQPTQGLVELPASVLDASDQIAQACPNGATTSRPLGEFVVTGRGSLPPNPLEALSGSTSLSPLASIDGEPNTNLPKTSSAPAIPPNSPTAIVEASGWVRTAQGKIALVASAPQAIPVATTVQATCPVPK